METLISITDSYYSFVWEGLMRVAIFALVMGMFILLQILKERDEE